jgi:hypothetical protein
MKWPTVLLVPVVLAATSTTFCAAPLVADTPEPQPAVMLSSETAAANPILTWVVRRAGGAVLRWVGGQVLDEVADYALDRSGLKTVLWNAADNLLGISNDRSISPEVRAELTRIRNDYLTYHRILSDNARSDAETRRRLLALHQNFVNYVQQTNRRLEVLDARITRVEQEQRRQLKMIVDVEGRVYRLENRLVDAEGRITNMEGRIIDLENITRVHDEILRPDPNRFLRHEAYLSGGLLYGNSPSLGGDAAVGAELAAQYNFNQYLGVFGGVSYLPLTASDVDSIPTGSSLTWDNVNAHLGATASLLSPISPVSFQLGAGGGISSSRLLFYEAGVERTSENGQELGTSSNVYMLVKAEIGVAPPAYTFEPIATVGYITFLEDVAYQGTDVSSNVGRNVWFVSLGVRVRTYLRGGDRRDLPAGLNR